jgi:hypothetical protein
MDNNNQYFETLARQNGELTEEVIINRIKECEWVVKELAEMGVWKIVIQDAIQTVKFLDDNWQTLDPDTQAFEKARILKVANKKLVDLPKQYLDELEALQEKLRENQNPETFIEKDNDNG